MPRTTIDILANIPLDYQRDYLQLLRAHPGHGFCVYRRMFVLNDANRTHWRTSSITIIYHILDKRKQHRYIILNPSHSAITHLEIHILAM